MQGEVQTYDLPLNKDLILFWTTNFPKSLNYWYLDPQCISCSRIILKALR